MAITFILIIVAVLATLLVIVMFALSRHKKSGTGDLKVIGKIASVETNLEPEGSVLIAGELWRAKSKDDSVIKTPARVRVVGFQDHLVLVEPLSDKL